MRMWSKESWQYKFTAYMMSQAISLLGSSIVSLAMIWYVTLQTGSGSIIAGITITAFLPQALVMLYGGVLADRHPPKKIVIISDSMIAVSTFILAIFFFTGMDNIPWVFFFNTLRSIGTGIQLPASKSILPQIVPKEHLIKANSLNTGIWSIIQLISPGLGGLTMSLIGIQYVLLIDVITAIISITILCTITIPTSLIPCSSENTRKGMTQGFNYIFNSKPLRTAILLYTVFQFLVVPASQLTPLLASRHIGEKIWILSAIETSFSIGALTASLLMAYKTPKAPRFKLIAISSIIFGSTMLLLLPARTPLLFTAIMFLMGTASPLYYTPLITHIQENTKESYIGRTFSYVDLFSTLSTPLGMMVFAPLSNISILLPFALPGTLLILLGLLISVKTFQSSTN